MLAAELRFISANPIELVHSHIARRPEPLTNRNSEVSQPLSDITQKLLAKNPEDRYQTAPRIVADLESCLAAVACCPLSLAFQPRWRQSLVTVGVVAGHVSSSRRALDRSPFVVHPLLTQPSGW